MYRSKEKQRQVRIENEKKRRARFIGERITSMNKYKTYYNMQQRYFKDNNNETEIDFKQSPSPKKVKQFIDRALELEVKRDSIIDEDKHLTNMRGGTHQWKNQLRQYND